MVSSCQFHYTWRSCFSICNILPCFVSRVYFRLSDDAMVATMSTPSLAVEVVRNLVTVLTVLATFEHL